MTKLKVLYGVSGEGMGHAMRSREVVRYLRSRGHEVKILGYDRSAALLSSEGSFMEIAGFNLSYRSNNVMRLQTIWRNIWRTPGVLKSVSDINGLIADWQPHIAITDFEPLTAHLSRRANLPLVSLDNIHQLTLDRNVPWKFRQDWLMAKAVIKLFVPRADWRFISVLNPKSVSKAAVTQIPPLIRPEVLTGAISRGDHVLVYDSFANHTLPAILRQLPYKFHVYGFSKSGLEDNIEYRKFSEASFMDDLRSAQAVIGTGGFTVMTEALALGKPFLAIPVAHHFEQVENGLEVVRHGYGQMLARASVKGLAGFLTNLDEYREHLKDYKQPSNLEALEMVEDRLLKLAI
jgi:uncharacterized protein (TIGR00661 family)